MAFQFKCSECNAHIEVDDEYRDKQVTCPYCRKPTVASETPASEATVAQQDAGVGPVPYAGAPDESKKKTILGWLALACIIIGLAMSFYLRSQMPGLMAGLDVKSMAPAEVQQEAQSRIMQRPDLIVAGLFGTCILPLTGVVLAIICIVRKIPPRWPAITALCILGGLMATSCIGQLLMNSGAASGAAGP